MDGRLRRPVVTILISECRRLLESYPVDLLILSKQHFLKRIAFVGLFCFLACDLGPLLDSRAGPLHTHHMDAIVMIAGAALLGGAIVAVRHAMRNKRRLILRAAAFPSEWDEILDQNLPPYPTLPANLKKELQGDINVFISEKSFEGCGDLELTSEIKVTIAAQACLLLLNRDDTCYPKLTTILVYPSTYVGGKKGLFNRDDDKSVRLGESWTTGVVVLAWDSVKRGAMNFEDGQNVVMHEFAHQLDQEDGHADGAPKLGKLSAYVSWARAFQPEFAKLQKKAKRGKRSVMNKYGATNPAEFFAVATESFYEKPKQMKKRHPELFEELKSYYRVDPLEWN